MSLRRPFGHEGNLYARSTYGPWFERALGSVLLVFAALIAFGCAKVLSKGSRLNGKDVVVLGILGIIALVCWTFGIRLLLYAGKVGGELIRGAFAWYLWGTCMYGLGLFGVVATLSGHGTLQSYLHLPQIVSLTASVGTACFVIGFRKQKKIHDRT
jgi:hypothetical protein